MLKKKSHKLPRFFVSFVRPYSRQDIIKRNFRINQVLLLVDSNIPTFWKHVEGSVFSQFNHYDPSLLWKTISAPDCVFATLNICQLVEKIKVWYVYRNVCLKTKRYFHKVDFIIPFTVTYTMIFFTVTWFMGMEEATK